MLPIVAAMMVQRQSTNRWRAAELSVWYVLALALTYAASGIVAASLGATLQSLLQTPWILGTSGFLLIVLAILLIAPDRFALSGGQTFINRIQNMLPYHTRWGAALLGVLSALVISPCVTPPLIGALIYIADKGDPYLGGSALFMLGLGSGLPLIIVALLGARFLPKSGRWMTVIQYIFALALCLVALSLWGRIGNNIFTPVANVFSGTSFIEAPTAPSVFHKVATVQELDQHLATARRQQQPVILDFYADWCTSCHIIEREVFRNPAVVASLTEHNFYPIQVDLTLNDADAKAIQAQWHVFGPPTMVFLDASGEEIRQLRLVGEFTREKFLEYLNPPNTRLR